MKKLNHISLALLLLIFLGACEQELITTTVPEPNLTNTNPDPCGGVSGTSGTASFTKFIAIGNSFVAGMQGGALYTEGQNNSLAAIINTQLACAGGTATFNQPSIRATLGWNVFITQPFLSDNTKPILGRMLLQGTPPRPNPQPYAAGNLEALPNPAANANFMYTGSSGSVPSAQLNNFSVAAIFLGQSLTPAAGNWANPNPAVGFTPFYARFASNPGTSTIIGDAAGAGGSFFLFWLGLDDFFLHAAFGGDGTLAPLTSTGAFAGQYGAAINSLLGSNANLKGVLGNFPDIFRMPHFTSVPFNAIPLSAADALAATNGLATPYNGFLSAMVANDIITPAERDKRLLTYVAGQNKILMTDETLTDLTPYMTGPAAGLVPYAMARQTAATDILPLGAGSILGTAGPGGSTYGVSWPVGDRYVLIPTEITAINAARTAFNATVQTTVTNNSAKLALADVSATMTTITTAQFAVLNGVTLTPNINPPTGIYSEDGAHFNTRGYAFIAKTFIEAINAKFGSTIPVTNMSKYKATGLPIP